MAATTETRETEFLLTAEEVRERLGLSRRYVYRLLADGSLRSLRIGRARRIRASDLEEFIQARLEGRDA